MFSQQKIMSGPRISNNGNFHNHNKPCFKKKKSSHYDSNRKALWLPWPPTVPVSKPFQILWMVVPDPVANSPAGSQPPLIANPPSQPLIIPSHVAHALLLTR